MDEGSASPLNLLLVEDSENDEILIRSHLRRWRSGIRLRRIASEEELLSALAEGGWDLVIGDYALPGFSGLAALDIVRRHDPDLPFIMVSGARGEDLAVEAMRSGAGDYIAKDNLSRLLPAMERELEARRDRRARRQADEALKTRNRLLALLSTLAERLLAAETPVDAASAAYRMIAGELDLHAYFNFLTEGDGSLRLDSWEGIPPHAARIIRRLRPGEAVCGLVARSRKAMHVTDIQRSAEERVRLLRRHGFGAYVCTPLCAGGRLLGTLSFGTKSRERFSDEELEFIGTVVRYVALADERMRTEEELRRSERRQRAFFENAAVGATELDPESHILRVNDFFCRMLGFSPEELLGRDIHTLTHPEDAGAQREGFETVVRGEKPFFEMEKRYLRRDSSVLWVLETTAAVRDPEGRPEWLTGIVQDITRRKEEETARERLLAELEGTISAIADAVVIYGPQGEVLRLNPAARRMFRLPPEPLPLRDRIVQLRAETPDGLPFPPERFPAARALRGETVQSEIVVYHPEGEGKPLWGAVSAAPIRDSEGRIIGAVSTVTDVTALHELQQENEIYVHTISHDLRTPLTVVMGHAELLETACPSEDSQVHVEAILRGAERMETMIENLVEAARLEGGNVTLEKEPVWLDDFLPAFLRQSSPALETSRISVDLSPDLPPVSADPARLERILTNLLTNAQKYSPPDSPIEVQARPQGEDILISVRDHGKGIDPEDLPHIFKKFHRTRNGRKAGGGGLGLFITASLVEAHGGRIRVESRPGRGSTFTFSLPVHKV